MNQSELFYGFALTGVPGVGDILLRQLVSYCGSASEVFRTPASRLKKIPGVGEVTAKAVTAPSVLQEAERGWERIGRLGVKLLFYLDEHYPARLRSLYDAPALLYLLGEADLNTARTIAVVGTRQATEYGRRITEELVQQLKPYSPLLISGLAYGIDIAAHRACLHHQVPTLGVMASGADIIYPAIHRKTAQDIQESGGILTEIRPGVKPEAHLFPARNRIIAGLSDVLVVVEAAAKGGALITAEYANNYHRDVFAVPGQLGHTFSQGCNKLIRENKAQIFTTTADLVEAMNWNAARVTAGPSEASKVNLEFTEEESQILAQLRKEPACQIDDLSWRCQIPMNRLASILLNLEFKNLVRSLPGKKYALQ